MFAKVIAALGLLICVLLAIDMALPRRHQMAWRAWVRRPGLLMGSGIGLKGRFNSRDRRRAAHDAALDAIARAKHRSGTWDGNVYHGDDFEQRQRRKPH
ncbi:hypothetical protein FUT87_15070 [Mitsuaria sp. TWR114]|jgi:hypothetical protein|uniref:hypothetical protein n=1 Tax=unclassified Roseateles TaxID=2626991 RepID=UPI0008E6336B|nr:MULTISPECIES: hypothetical protein [unclassified Roseateles]MBB3284489.1 hypothetical protein [Mitsuaria sp. BK037]MBB3291614.1 hypothetical protein [Mitsuaria sp. BK041]MBB3360831.1 hypothetical protein [Mitsuaria sp. BK045]TXD80966.1 hypothetical protein FUT87_18315 [Mitsuaria sp. TWR114]TXD85810.1 hypothetical protein FUT87_15070 [Mitsuaria sp. TWR114]